MNNEENNPPMIVGSIRFNSAFWEKYFVLDRAINDRVTENMYKALKGIVESPKLLSLQGNDQKAFNKCKKALKEYEISYNSH